MDPTLLRCHDYQFLIRRWRKVARAAGLTMTAFARSGEYDLFVLTSRISPEQGVYLSAGIHGDEPAGTEGLVRWAESHIEVLRELPCVIFPCLNPWGLVHNTRLDEHCQDLNRLFHHDKVPFIQALKAHIEPYRFSLSLTLHEDYDGQGLYIYEIERCTPFWGEDLLELVRPLIPIEGRTTIDGRRASKAGLMRRRINLKKFPMIPEAVFLHVNHSQRTFTFETPSEFALDQRVQVQIALVDECIRRTLKTLLQSTLTPAPARSARRGR